MPNKNDGKRWSTRDKRDLADALGRGDTTEQAANFLLRSGTVGEVARIAAELGLLGDGGTYSIVLFREGGEDAGCEMETRPREPA